MKKLLLFTVLLFCVHVFGQIRTYDASTAKKKSYQAFPIHAGSVAATPISIPGPNNTPVALEMYSSGMVTYSNTPRNATINACSFVEFKDKSLKLRVSHSINFINNKPIYVGAWFYDTSGNALNVGYFPKIISPSQADHSDVLLKFYDLPIVSDYLEVMLLQNGKTIDKKRFQCNYEWKEVAAFHVMEAAAIGKIAEPLKSGTFALSVPDLEVTGVKVVMGKTNSTVEYGNTCIAGDKMIFITNKGTKESDAFQVLIGYYKKLGNRSKYIEVARVNQPVLQPGKQTLFTIGFPEDADNIQISLKYLYGGNGEVNSNNNILSKKCHMIR